jgi:hypothetical protein
VGTTFAILASLIQVAIKQRLHKPPRAPNQLPRGFAAAVVDFADRRYDLPDLHARATRTDSSHPFALFACAYRLISLAALSVSRRPDLMSRHQIGSQDKTKLLAQPVFSVRKAVALLAQSEKPIIKYPSTLAGRQLAPSDLYYPKAQNWL